jgi:hypothetical protein
MKIELIKKTMKITGKEYYYVSVDGDNLISETWTTDLEKANENFSKIIEDCKRFPEEKIETIKLQML